MGDPWVQQVPGVLLGDEVEVGEAALVLEGHEVGRCLTGVDPGEVISREFDHEGSEDGSQAGQDASQTTELRLSEVLPLDPPHHYTALILSSGHPQETEDVHQELVMIVARREPSLVIEPRHSQGCEQCSLVPDGGDQSGDGVGEL